MFKGVDAFVHSVRKTYGPHNHHRHPNQKRVQTPAKDGHRQEDRKRQRIGRDERSITAKSQPLSKTDWQIQYHCSSTTDTYKGVLETIKEPATYERKATSGIIARKLLPKSSRTTFLDPMTCTLITGSSDGAEARFAEAAEIAGMHVIHMTFKEKYASDETNNPCRTKKSPDCVSTSDKILDMKRMGHFDAEIHAIMTDLKKPFDNNTPFLQNMYRTWATIVSSADALVCIGTFGNKDRPGDERWVNVKSDTGLAVRLAKNRWKMIYMFDDFRRAWFAMDYHHSSGSPEFVRMETTPRFQSALSFAGLGAKILTSQAGREIDNFFENTFGWNPRTRERVAHSSQFDPSARNPYEVRYNHHNLHWKCPYCMIERCKNDGTFLSSDALRSRLTGYSVVPRLSQTVQGDVGVIGSRRPGHGNKQ